MAGFIVNMRLSLFVGNHGCPVFCCQFSIKVEGLSEDVTLLKACFLEYGSCWVPEMDKNVSSNRIFVYFRIFCPTGQNTEARRSILT